jgi:hypothetical protein
MKMSTARLQELKQHKYVTKVSNHSKKNELFLNRFSIILLVQSKLLPPSALGIKDLKNKL